MYRFGLAFESSTFHFYWAFIVRPGETGAVNRFHGFVAVLVFDSEHWIRCCMQAIASFTSKSLRPLQSVIHGGPFASHASHLPERRAYYSDRTLQFHAVSGVAFERAFRMHSFRTILTR